MPNSIGVFPFLSWKTRTHWRRVADGSRVGFSACFFEY
nr:MAG TPA: hypothetical protein [Caudoviricetes sp.]